MKFIDYYALMDLDETASAAEIKKTYKRLARKYHPDVSKEQEAEEKFKEISEAYAVLGNEEKKAEYDELRKYRQNESEYSIPPEWQHREGDSGFYHHGQEGFSDFFESIFRQGQSHRPREASRSRGEDIMYVLPVSLEEAFNGGQKTISYQILIYDANGMPSQYENSLKVRIPKDVAPGQQLRLRGKGHSGFGDIEAGDLYLQIEITPHELFTIEGKNLIQSLSVAPWELALGCDVQIQTMQGLVKLTIPKNSKPGQKLRIKGKGLRSKQAGDLYVILKVKFPEVETEAQRAAFEALKNQFDFDPRKIEGIA